MSNFDDMGKIVVSITAQKNLYYRSRLSRWTADLKKAREFLTPEEAQQEADRIGSVVFQGEHCLLCVVRVETLSRRR